MAKRLGVSRSEFYQRALATYVERHDDVAVTAVLDEIYSESNREERLDPVLAEMQPRTAGREEWQYAGETFGGRLWATHKAPSLVSGVPYSSFSPTRSIAAEFQPLWRQSEPRTCAWEMLRGTCV